MTLLCQANGTNASIPIIDISSPDDDVAANLLEAASTYGFIFIKNTGSEIPQQLVEDMFGMVTDRRSTRIVSLHTDQGTAVSAIFLLARRSQVGIFNFLGNIRQEYGLATHAGGGARP